MYRSQIYKQIFKLSDYKRFRTESLYSNTARFYFSNCKYSLPDNGLNGNETVI